MIKNTKNAFILNKYLEAYTFCDLPDDMWNRHLWLYQSIISLMDIPFGKSEFNPEIHKFYELHDYTGICGIVFLKEKNDTIEIHITSHSNKAVEEFFQSDKVLGKKVTHIFTPDENIRSYLTNKHKINDISGMVTYYTEHIELVDSEYEVICIDNLSIVNHPEINHLDYPIRVLNYFGLKHDEMIKATCGLAPITKNHFEVIGLNTYDLNNRRKGYAKKLSEYVIFKALERGRIVTWQTQLDNIASRKTAESLSLKEILRVYKIEL